MPKKIVKTANTKKVGGSVPATMIKEETPAVGGCTCGHNDDVIGGGHWSRRHRRRRHFNPYGYGYAYGHGYDHHGYNRRHHYGTATALAALTAANVLARPSDPYYSSPQYYY